MINNKYSLNNYIEIMKEEVSTQSLMVVKRILVGKGEPIDLALVYVSELIDKNIVDRDILQPLMLHIDEEISSKDNIADYLAKKYISMSNTIIMSDINEAAKYGRKTGVDWDEVVSNSDIDVNVSIKIGKFGRGDF